MRKETLMKKLVSAVVTTAMVASLVVVTPTQAEAATDVALTPWSFFQSGTSMAGLDGNNYWEQSYFTGLITSAGEVLTEADFPKGTLDGSGKGSDVGDTDKPLINTTQVANGFDIEIGSNGWQANYGTDRASYNNPWTLRAHMNGFKMEYAHKYTVSFTANIQAGAAMDSKLAKITIGDNDTNIYAGETIKLTTEAQEYTYTFTVNNDQVKSGAITLFLGAFPIIYREDTLVKDYITPIENTGEVNWAGTVSIADFKIVDEGVQEMPKEPVDPDQPSNPSNPSNPTNPSKVDDVKAPGKAKIKKVYSKKKASKKLKVKVKKISGAAGYQFQVSKKSSFKSKNLLIKKKNTTKTTYTLSNSKLKNKSKLYVRVRAYAKKADGTKVYGAWSKSKKAKIK